MLRHTVSGQQCSFGDRLSVSVRELFGGRDEEGRKPFMVLRFASPVEYVMNALASPQANDRHFAPREIFSKNHARNVGIVLGCLERPTLGSWRFAPMRSASSESVIGLRRR